MSRIICFMIAILAAVSIMPPALAEQGRWVSYYISFDDFSFLDDCYIARSKLKTPEERKLSLVEGRYGKALHLGAVPLIMDDDNMSGLDLDLVTAVIYNVAMAGRKGTGYDEPFIWGAGKLHPAYGAVAFWVKGPLRPDMLFEQTSSAFGRKEKELVEVRLEEDGSVSAYVEDARYVRHAVRTKPVWKADRWTHIVFQWNKAAGVSLWIDGREAASSMGEDAWWENQRPGLFHLPMAKAAYDEFYIFGRPLTGEEVGALYRENKRPGGDNDPIYLSMDTYESMKAAFCADSRGLPVLDASAGGTLLFRRITPDRIHDEGVSGWWLADGRYECAWPHEYALFTIVPGDADYHADHADIIPPKGADVNYITLEGNLGGLRVLKGDRDAAFMSRPVAEGPGTGFFLGAMVDGLGDAPLRLPFTKERGTPPDFGGDGVQLPLSGDLRVHEVGLFNVSMPVMPERPGDMRLYIHPALPGLDDDSRYGRALRALCPSFERGCASLTDMRPRIAPEKVQLAPMRRMNLFTEPFPVKTPVGAVILDLWVASDGAPDNILIVAVPNPAVPSQTWTHAEARLEGIDRTAKYRRVRLALEFDPLVLSPGDRLWMRILSTDGLDILTGDPERPSTVTIRPCLDRIAAETSFSSGTMRPRGHDLQQDVRIHALAHHEPFPRSGQAGSVRRAVRHGLSLAGRTEDQSRRPPGEHVPRTRDAAVRQQ